MAFSVPQTVLFRHCDPAGIVFYPRYFEMVNDAVEAFFDRALGLPFGAMHRTHGVPTVSIASEFRAPSRLGDRLAIGVVPTRVGRTSAALAVAATCGGERRFETRLTLVHVELATMRPARWPDGVRRALAAALDPSTEPAADGRVPAGDVP